MNTAPVPGVRYGMRLAFNLAIAGLGLALAGCGEKPAKSDAAPQAQAPQKHHHEPPHGGTVVELGEEEFHLELVLDATAGKMQAYVLDGHMENFVRVALPQIELTAQVSGKDEPLVFKPVANGATGETVGDTSQFDAQADWLKSAKSFDAVLKEVTVKGKSYKDVKFNFPKGND